MIELPRRYFDLYPREKTLPLIEISPALITEDRIFSSQTFINPVDIKRARDHHAGRSTYRSPYPSIYPFINSGRACFLIGDGHHRIADAFLRKVSIIAEIDDDFGEIGDTTLSDPIKARIRYAKYGIEGIWPYSDFLAEFQKLQSQTLL